MVVEEKTLAIKFLDLLQIKGWRLKVYEIICGRTLSSKDIPPEAQQTNYEFLLDFAADENQPGEGFLGFYHGENSSCIFLDWRDGDAYLHRVFTSSADKTRFDVAGSVGMTAYLYDLQKIGEHQEFWGKVIPLSNLHSDLGAYLHTCLEQETAKAICRQ